MRKKRFSIKKFTKSKITVSPQSTFGKNLKLRETVRPPFLFVLGGYELKIVKTRTLTSSGLGTRDIHDNALDRDVIVR